MRSREFDGIGRTDGPCLCLGRGLILGERTVSQSRSRFNGHCAISKMVLSMRPVITFMMICLILGGCATTDLPSDGSVTQLSANAMPAPTRTYGGIERPFYIGPLDQLAINVVGMRELDQNDIQVDTSGRITFPLIGTIEASGKTPLEVAEMIERGLRARFIRDPQVTVNVKTTASQLVTVDGQVREPGIYPIMGNMTLLRAVAVAKGTTEFAKLDDVVVLRTVDGRNYAALYNLAALRKGIYSDPAIYTGDVVVVGDSKARRLFRDILSVVPLLTTPIIVALQN